MCVSHGPYPHNLGEPMPRKGYKPQPGRSPGMPEKLLAQNFNRRICPAEVAVLTAAGFGSKTDGFRNLLCMYQELHNMGYRTDMVLKDFLRSLEGVTADD